MRTITKNKSHKVSYTKAGTVCLFCKKNKVELKDWNKRCTECKETLKKEQQAEINSGIGRRQPAAIITTDTGQKVFVDKFGKEVDNPGYDLDHDPRGFGKTGVLPPKREIIE